MSIFGGYLKDIPEPHKRMFPGEKKRAVKVTVMKYDMVAGGIHYHVTMEEGSNPIWDSSVEDWRGAWDDDDLGGAIEHETTDTIGQATDFIKRVWSEKFSDDTHYLHSFTSTKEMSIDDLDKYWRELFKPMPGDRYYYQREGG